MSMTKRLLAGAAALAMVANAGAASIGLAALGLVAMVLNRFRRG